MEYSEYDKTENRQFISNIVWEDKMWVEKRERNGVNAPKKAGNAKLIKKRGYFAMTAMNKLIMIGINGG